MKTIQFCILIGLCTYCCHAQNLTLGKQTFQLYNAKGEITKLDGKKVLKIERDLKALPFDEKNLEATVDEPHYARLKGLDDFENGIIEVSMYSEIQNPSPFAGAAGFIGVFFRINEDNSAFESIYLRPKVGRINNQFARNHAVQYFAYPHAKFQTLRDNYPTGTYEGSAPVGLNEWIKMRIVVKGETAEMYINDLKQSSFVVNKLLGTNKKGSIGLYVDIGTIGYFKDLKVTRLPSNAAAAAEPTFQETKEDILMDRFFTTSDGVKLHYRVSGKGAPLVIFPGYGQDVAKFDKVYPELEKHFTVYNLDYRWLGQSESPTYGYHIERFAKDAKEMIDHAKIKKFNLLGHSMGNAVSWCYFSLFGQDQVMKYILGDESPCLVTDPHWTDIEVETYTGSKNRKELFKAWQPPTKPENMSMQQDMMLRLLNDHLGRDWRDVIPTIKVPTMVLMGGKSHFESPLLYNWLHENIKGSKLEIIKDGGHGYYESHPEEFNKLIIDFLTKNN